MLFDNQVIAVEVDVDFSRHSTTNASNISRNGPCFTISAYLHRTMTTIQCSSASRSAAVVELEHAPESFSALDLVSDRTCILI